MKKLTAVLALLAFVPVQLSAWGPKGHAIVADIAAAHLTPTAKSNLQLLLGNDSLASVASWADDVRKQRDESYDWHFVDIPKDASGFSQERDCFRPQDIHKDALTDHHNCVVDRIEMFQRVLGDETASRAERLEALKWIVHFGSDQCGNYPCNLHWTWDTLLLEHTGYSEEDYVHRLEQLIAEKNLTAQAGGTPEQWANESHLQARRILEAKPVAIDEQYYRDNIGLVDQKLALAGLRLSTVLNNTLGKVPAAKLQPDGDPHSPRK